MEMTQKDYEDRKARVDAGSGDDDDARLVKQYEQQGYTVGNAGNPTADRADNNPVPPPAERPAAGEADRKTNNDDGPAKTRPTRVK